MVQHKSKEAITLEHYTIYPISKEFSKQSFQNTPLKALSDETIKILSNLLNKFMVTITDDGYERDWRGLAALSDQRDLCCERNNVDDPLKQVIQNWCENQATTATFGNLVKYLGIIDRWHVIEDVKEHLLEDFLKYQIKQK